MQITSHYTLPVSQALAWEALHDAALLQSSIPGCESLTATGETRYDIAMTVEAGATEARFEGTLRFADLVPNDSYKLAFEGTVGAAGHAEGIASVKLEATGPDTTLLHCTAEVAFDDPSAQLDAAQVEVAARSVVAEFFDNFDVALATKYPPMIEPLVDVPPLPERPTSALGRTMVWLKGLFGQ